MREIQVQAAKSISMALIAIFVITGNLSSADTKTIQGKKINPNDINLDGQLDESVWTFSDISKEFIQRDPTEGEPATEETMFSVLYDEEYLYIGIKASVSDPEKIKGILSRRDEESPSDWLYVSIDSYNDNRTAFEFGLNPLGVKRDLRRYDDEMEDPNWDALWEGETSRFNGGWSAEFKIPFRELRFSNGGVNTWGIQVYRYMADNNEESYWTYWPKEETGWVRHYGDLTGLDQIPRQRRLYFSPYVTGSYNKAAYYKNPVHPETFDLKNTLGADMKFGITNNLTLDLSVNPDFGQVEADPAELNISAFESYFPEKRPFFVEGGNIFNFSMGLGDGDQSRNSLFYTRRIGRSPHDYAENDDGYETNPVATKILTAGKISGKTANGWSIGILDAVTAKEVGVIKYEDDTPTERLTVEPLTNYFVTRLQKDFNESQTTIGGMVTSTFRDIKDDHLNYLNNNAFTGGVDFTHRWDADRWTLQGALSGTDLSGTSESILDKQTNSIHYFQRPDAKHLSVDSSATHLTGFAHKLALSRNHNEHWQGSIGEMTFSPGFDANDLGFHRNVDRQTQFIWVQYRENDPGKILRRYSVNFNLWHGMTFGGERLSLGGNVNGNVTFLNYWQIGGGYNLQAPNNHTTALWGGPSIRNDVNRNLWVWINSDQRKDISINGFVYNGGSTTGTTWYGGEPGITWRPLDNLSVSALVNYHHTYDTWANWSDYEASENLQTGEMNYIMADLTMTNLSATIRLDFTITPNLTVQYYGSPYVSAGKYRNHKLVTNPQATEFDDRFYHFSDEEIHYNNADNTWEIDSDLDGTTNYIVDDTDFNYRQFNSNLVIRWEYVTGSALYLVWSQNASEYLDYIGEFNFGQDLNGLYRSADFENIVMLKFSYLFNI